MNGFLLHFRTARVNPYSGKSFGTFSGHALASCGWRTPFTLMPIMDSFGHSPSETGVSRNPAFPGAGGAPFLWRDHP